MTIYSNDTIKTIIASRLILKAKGHKKGGDGFVIMALFEMSTEWQCFFEFTTPVSKTHRKNWKYVTHHSIYSARPVGSNVVNTDPEYTIFLMNMKYKIDGDWSLIFPRNAGGGKKMVHSTLWRISNPVRQDPPAGATFHRVEKKLRYAREGIRVGTAFSDRDRSLDTPRLPPSDEVWYYSDDCPDEDCEKTSPHRVAHFPSGKVMCMEYSQLMDHPALYYSSHDSNTGIFIFKYKAPVSQEKIIERADAIKRAQGGAS